MNTPDFVKSGIKTLSASKSFIMVIYIKSGQKFNTALMYGILSFSFLLFGFSNVFVQFAQADDVVLWNRLGDNKQATNSEVGPPLVQTGDVNYESGRFGNGVRMDSSFPGYFLLDESLINSLILNSRGTIALWVKTSWPSSGVGTHILFDTSLGLSSQRLVLGYWGDGAGTIVAGFFPIESCIDGWQINLTGTYSSHGIHFETGQWHHWAMVWDNNGIGNTTDLFRLYFDGSLALVGNPNCPVRNDLPPSRLNYLGRHNWDGIHADAILDNIVFYDFAKTDFSDRFNENPVIQLSIPSLLSLGDINKDGALEIAVVTYNPTLKKSTATVKNTQTGALVKQIPFNGQFVPTKANVLPDLNGNGASEIAVLGVRSSDQAVQVEVRDSLSGVKLSAVPFDPAFKPLDLGVVRDINGKGTAGLAVLQQNATQLRVQLKNALSGAQIRNISFNTNYNGIDLLVISDLNANQSRELAVLADNKTVTAADTVEIRDSKTGVLIRTISYGTGKDLQQLINLPDLNNSGGAELAVLRANTARVLVKDAKTGLPVNTLDYAVSQPFRLATAADSNSQTNLAMLGVRAATGQPRADVHAPLSDTFINKVIYDNYGTTVGFISIPDINGNGVAELVRLREQPGPQKLFAEVRDGRTGVLIQGMYF